MTVTVFTLCSNNYLAQAKTLGDSLKSTNPGVHFVIGLVDKLHSDIDYSFFSDFEILPFYDLGYGEFDRMLANYKIVEFNTAVKPFYFEFLFRRSGDGSLVYYIDPDIEFYSGLEQANGLLGTYEFLITPHIITPSLEINRFETVFLNVGIFNLGFLGLRNTRQTMHFLHWWQERLRTLCFNNTSKGLFVDQIWINFLGSLFQGVHILKSPAYNMACWNIHERKVLVSNGQYFVNDQDNKLVFFHFSGFKPGEMNFVCSIREDAYSLKERPDLIPLFQGYAERLKANGFDKFSRMASLLGFAKRKYSIKQRIGLSLKRRVNRYIRNYFDVE